SGQFIQLAGSASGDGNWIHHNYFVNHNGPGGNGNDPIETHIKNTLVEYNLFEQCNGDPEVVSDKTSDNIYRFNTIVNCKGHLSLRDGDRCLVQGNLIFNSSGGIRVYGSDHFVFNNYVEGCTFGMLIGSGTGTTAYAPADRAQVVFNTL